MFIKFLSINNNNKQLSNFQFNLREETLCNVFLLSAFSSFHISVRNEYIHYEFDLLFRFRFSFAILSIFRNVISNQWYN
jgi:hypothetical protein